MTVHVVMSLMCIRFHAFVTRLTFIFLHLLDAPHYISTSVCASTLFERPYWSYILKNYCVLPYEYCYKSTEFLHHKVVEHLLLSSLPSAVPTMRLSQDSSRLPFCLFFFGRFTSPGGFWIFFPFRSFLT